MNIADDTMNDDGLDHIFGTEPPRHDAHVLLFYGFDLSAAGLWELDELRPCPFCVPPRNRTEPRCLSSEKIWNGARLIHFVQCGGCGTRGPWGESESEAIAVWDARA